MAKTEDVCQTNFDIVSVWKSDAYVSVWFRPQSHQSKDRTGTASN